MFNSIGCRATLITALVMLMLPVFADPMRPDTRPLAPQAAPAPTPEPSLTLTSIYRLGERAYVVINGRQLSLNESLGRYQLTAIGQKQVTLQRGDRIRILTLQQAGALAITPNDEE